MRANKYYANKRGSDFDEEVLATMISQFVNTKQTENHDIINKLFEILPSEFIALINDINIDISQSFDLLTENYKLSQKMATIKNQLVEDDILKEDCK
jgi:hypothetical protein